MRQLDEEIANGGGGAQANGTTRHDDIRRDVRCDGIGAAMGALPDGNGQGLSSSGAAQQAPGMRTHEDGGRRGPRPLALYLQLAAAASAAEPGRVPGGAPSATPEGLRRFLDGLRAYWAHPHGRQPSEPPTLWADGSARLLDYGGPGGRPILIVPSLINRSYILDLTASRSFVAFLAGAGYRPLLLDWGRPHGPGLHSTLAELIHGQAQSALDAALRLTGQRPVLLGYCMGGLVACALAQNRGNDLAGLALLATPWDFHAGSAGLAPQLATGLVPVTVGIATLGHAPVELLQAFFVLLDPLRVVRKFQRFAELPADSPQARLFVAVEDWLNDGVPLAGPVAQECLWHWYVENRPGLGTWAPGGEPVRPERLDLPAFVAIPQKDRIVTAGSAESLARRLRQPTVVRPAGGHISMLVGDAAPAELWQPFTRWLRRIA